MDGCEGRGRVWAKAALPAILNGEALAIHANLSQITGAFLDRAPIANIQTPDLWEVTNG